MASVTVFMVAEKPSLAESITKILAPNGQYQTRKSYTSVHEYNGQFRNQNARFKFTSVTELSNRTCIQSHNNWDATDPLELFTAPTLKLEANSKQHITKHLQNESRGADYVVLWLDCDREGENICFEVVDNVFNSMKEPQKTKESRILRAKFSAITHTDIRKAMDNLIYPNKNESLAVDARQELDLKIGCAFTRFQTRFFQGKYGNLDAAVISYGPCQTPTLSFCVSRHDQIQSFSPEPFWSVAVTVARKDNQNKNKDKEETVLHWKRERVFDRQIARIFESTVKEANEAIVISVKSERKTKSRPHALNTVELLKHGSSALGIGPHDVMSIAERLYMQGYISYPRTETTSYPKNFDLNAVLRMQQNHGIWGSYASELLENGVHKPSGGVDVGDHPPITPMRKAEEGDLSGDTWRVYSYVTRHFLGSISPDMRYIRTTAIVKINNEIFECSGSRVDRAGFTSILYSRTLSDTFIPEYKEGERLDITDVKLTEGLTHPPDYLTESEVIGLMEKHGIGTDASIPVHINNICQRNYVKVEGNARRLVPTNLEKIDPDLSLPTMRSDVEKQLNYIALGQAKFKDVLDHSLKLFSAKFKYFTDKIGQMDELFEATFSVIAETGKIMSRCGKCRRPERLHCKTCDETYSLPQNGSIKPYKELKCPLDDFELVLFSIGSDGMGYPMCPYCYNYPPFENISKGIVFALHAQ
ncbi:972_t:CDS:10, partial [Paraglomus brasilianum]